ncbi:uncharacterized protein BO88DRAFT_35636 [Aspergillus vadensis CBS 113365]|uniref:Uncharacterized protein n=1 Tax=Aspergillus vadensis (strain CBS 113365 / IMI 142717 / IBT 24658) TaxID=1448311 RepID=A0A319BAC8_ASPVC|nr:hypothetical protein BO88DRAFT_35636 [Aspergillus vadensis CBS 113365]PYH69535.1 hypothetical protein BO88DRAFT_35636 [Aspergillus vadensis CBS 113365]
MIRFTYCHFISANSPQPQEHDFHPSNSLTLMSPDHLYSGVMKWPIDHRAGKGFTESTTPPIPERRWTSENFRLFFLLPSRPSYHPQYRNRDRHHHYQSRKISEKGRGNGKSPWVYSQLSTHVIRQISTQQSNQPWYDLSQVLGPSPLRSQQTLFRFVPILRMTCFLWREAILVKREI